MARWIYRRLRDMKFTFALLAAFFLFGIFSGYAGSMADPASAKQIFAMLKLQLKPILALKDWNLVAAIFLNNLRVCAILFVVSLIAPFVLSALGLLANGFIVGLVLWVSGEKTHSINSMLLGLLPHGILELPAVLLAASAGSVIGIELFRAILGRIGWVPKRKLEIPKKLWVWAVVAVILLIPAAVIEVFISPKLLHH